MGRNLLGLVTVVAVLGAGSNGSSQSGENPEIGVWKLNLAQSKYDPGPSPKSQTITIEAMGNGGIKQTHEGVAADGSRIAYSFSAKYDDRDYPESGVGMSFGSDTIALKRVDAYTVEATLKKAGRIVLTNRVVYSKDGRLRTITGKGTNANGQPTTNVVVYERQ